MIKIANRPMEIKLHRYPGFGGKSIITVTSSLFVPDSPDPAKTYLKISTVLDSSLPVRRTSKTIGELSNLQRFRWHYKRIRQEHFEAITNALNTARYL